MTECDENINSFEAQIAYNHQENNVHIQDNEIDTFSFEKIVSFYDNYDLSLKKEIKEIDDENKAIDVDIFHDSFDAKNELINIVTDESFNADDEDQICPESKSEKRPQNKILTNKKNNEKVISLLDIDKSTENSSEIEGNEHDVIYEENEMKECKKKSEIQAEEKNYDDVKFEHKLFKDIISINELLEKIEIKDKVSGDELQECEKFISEKTNHKNGDPVEVLSVQEKNKKFDDGCDNDCSFYGSSDRFDVHKDENNFHTCCKKSAKYEFFSDNYKNTDLIYNKNTEKSDEDNFNDRWKIWRESCKKCEEFLEDCDAIKDKIFNENSDESDEDNDYESYENFHTNIEKYKENSLSNNKVRHKDTRKWKFYENDQICKKLEQIKISNADYEEIYGENNSADFDDSEQDILRSRGPEKGSQKKHNDKPYGKKSTQNNSNDCFRNEYETKQISHNFPTSFDTLLDESLNACFSDSGYASSPASSIQFIDANEDKAKSSNAQLQRNVEEFTNLTLLELFSEEHVLRNLESIVNDSPNNVLGHDGTSNQSSTNINSSNNDNIYFNMNDLNNLGKKDSNDNSCQISDGYFQEYANDFCLQQIIPKSIVNNDIDGEANESSAVKTKSKTLRLKKSSKNLTSITVPEKKTESPKKVVPLVCKFQDGNAKSQLYSILHKDRLRLALSKYYRRNQVSETDEIIYVTDLKGEKGKHLNMTNLHVAVLNSDFEEIYAIVELQKQYKKFFFDINRTDAAGKTALDYAVNRNLPLIGDYLKENNAQQSIVINK